MPTYAVQFYTAEGRYLRRTIDADTVEAAKAALRREGHHPVSARPAKRNSRLLKVRLTTRQQVELFEQLELHLGSGVEAASALDEIRQSASHKSVRTVADVMYRSLATAKLPISDCFAMFPRSFPPSIISEIKAGEVGGRPALAKTCATLR